MQRDEGMDRELSARLEIHRRRFLGILAAGTGAVALAACSSNGGSDGADGADTTTTRARTSTTRSATTTDEVPPATGIDSDPFLLGVASGDPLPTSVILWTRLITDLKDTTGTGGIGDGDLGVRWEVATDKGFTKVVASGVEPAPADLGRSVHVDVQDLEPGSWYWYRFRIGEHTSPVARTRTAPANDAPVDKLVLAFASCQLRTAGNWTAYPHLVADGPDLIMFLGDYVYEYPGGSGDTATTLTKEPQSLADYRVLYADYKRDPKLQAAHAVAPWVVTWDDHEVENNYAGEVPEHEDDDTTFPDRRKAAYQAFWEHHPVRLDPPADDGSVKVYRTLRWGKLADIFVLDGRQYRSDQVCGDHVATNVQDCAEIDDEDHTMLGKEQEAWLTDGLEGSEATWKVLAQQTVMYALKLGDIVLNVDQWDGYPAARRRLLGTIKDNDIENVVILTGDIHAAGAADIRYPDAGPTGPIVATEMVGTSISSPGLAAAVGNIDLSPLGLLYANFENRGYSRCTVTPTTFRTDFVVVDTIDAATSPARVDASVEVTAGQEGMRRLS